MSRLQADLCLLLAALIWGAAFVAQKDAMAHMGAFTFVAARFAISAALLLPFAVREAKQPSAPKTRQLPFWDFVWLGVSFCGGVIFQQVGIAGTSVTNAGFLTGLYVLFVPLICAALFKQRLPRRIYPAALLAVAGVWLLSGSGADILQSFSRGDFFVLLCAVSFAVQVVMIGRIMEKWRAPLRVCLYQYAIVTIVSWIIALAVEAPTMAQILEALWPVLYAGLISGGVAYTLQVVAQQYTPASDTAVLLSAESVFAAFFGWWLAGDSLSALGWLGCGFIGGAILVVEIWPLLRSRSA